MFETDLFIKRFKMIEEVMSESKLIELGKKAFLEEIKSDELGETEKAQAAASFLSQIVTSALNIAAESALRVGISYEEEKAKKENTYHQSEMAKEQINKLSLEKDLVKAQINLTNQQEDIEQAKYQSALLDIEIKDKQVQISKINAIEASEKIKILNKTADDNLRVKVGELHTQFMQIALSKDWVKLDDKAGTSLYTHILNSIQDILTKSRNITLDTNKLDKIITDTLVDKNNKTISSDTKKADNYNVLISNYTPNLDEIVSIMALSSDSSVAPKIYLNNQLIFSGFATSFKITSKKDYIVKVEFKTGITKEYKLSVV